MGASGFNASWGEKTPASTWYSAETISAPARAAFSLSAITSARMSLMERTRSPGATNTGW